MIDILEVRKSSFLKKTNPLFELLQRELPVRETYLENPTNNQDTKLPLTFSIFHLSSEKREPFEVLQRFAPFCVGPYEKVFLFSGSQNEERVKDEFQEDATGVYSRDLYWDESKKVGWTFLSEGRLQELLHHFPHEESSEFLGDEFKNCLILFDEASFSYGLIDLLTPLLNQVILLSEKSTVDFVESYQMIKSLLMLNKNLRADFFLIEDEKNADLSLLHDFETIANKNLPFNGTCQFFFEKYFEEAERNPSQKRRSLSFKFSFKEDTKHDALRAFLLNKLLKRDFELFEEKV